MLLFDLQPRLANRYLTKNISSVSVELAKKTLVGIIDRNLEALPGLGHNRYQPFPRISPV